MKSNLKQKTISGVIWRGLETLGSTGAQFVVSIVLARLLLPEQFGLIAMLTVFMQLANTFVASGFPKALIQKKETSYADECSVFYFNILISLAVYGLLFVFSPWVARFYGQPQLTSLLRVLSVGILIGALGQIHQTLLIKAIDFRRQAVVGWVSMLVSGLAGVMLALKGFGVWALVVQQLVSVTVRTAMFWGLSPWRPGWVFSLVSLRTMFRFGSKLLASSLLDTVFNNIYVVVIGKLFTPSALGFYQRGRSLPSLLMNTVNGTVDAVIFPAYTTIQHDRVRMKHVARRSLKVLYFLTLPLMLGLCASAEPLVRILLTEKWLPCVPYLQLLCLAYATGPFHVVNLQIITALGRSDLFLRLELIKTAIDTVMILVTYRFGVLPLVAGQLVTAVFSVVLNSHYNGRLILYPTIEQIKDLLPTVGLSVLMGAVVWWLGRLDFGNDYLRFSVQVVCGIVVYLGGCVLVKLDGYYEVLAILRQQFFPSARESGS